MLTKDYQNNVFDVMDELIMPLNTHVSSVVNNAQAGELHSETKKVYFSFLGALMKAKLQDIFTSERMRYSPCCCASPMLTLH